MSSACVTIASCKDAAPRIREVALAKESRLFLSAGHLHENHLHPSNPLRLRLRGNLRHFRSNGCDCTNRSLACAANPCCVTLDRDRVYSSYRDRPGRPGWRIDPLVHLLLAPTASRDRSAYCLARSCSVPVGSHYSNCHCPTWTSCRFDRGGTRSHLCRRKRSLRGRRQSHRRLVHDERSCLPDLRV